MREPLDELLVLQSGVVSRRQLLAAGWQPHDVRRLQRRRDLTRIHDGVYVEHTGQPTWLQRAWAAVLFAWPAALCHDSALRVTDGPGRRDRHDSGRIHLAVDRKRGVVAPEGVQVHQLADLAAKVQWNSSPPRVRTEHALVDVASEAESDFAAVAALAAAIQARRTTADRVLAALTTRSRIARRRFLRAALCDIGAGTCSVLERGYLECVERPHGLPAAGRQVRASHRGTIYRDVEYEQFATVVELDGRLFHDGAAARNSDLDRDLDAVVGGRVTARLGWGQVFDRPCDTAVRIGVLLQQRGWTGVTLPCARCSGQPGIRAAE